MKLKDIKSCDSGDWVANTLRFIEDNYGGCGLSPDILLKLKKLHSQGRIVAKDLAGEALGGYNHLTRRLTLNSSKFGFLHRDFKRQLEALEKNKEPPRLRHIEDQHARAIIELSGTLIHEGRHASQYIWNRAKDETAAFTAEQIWYRHLHSLDSKYRNEIAALSRDAEADSRSRSYRGLKIEAPSQIV